MGFHGAVEQAHGLALLRSALTGHPFLSEVAPITGPMYQLYIFFMITDPKTTVRPVWGQCLVAFLVAAVEAVSPRTQPASHAVSSAAGMARPGMPRPGRPVPADRRSGCT